MKKFRKLLFLVVLGLMSVFVVACGDDTDAKNKEELESVLELLGIGFHETGDTHNSVTGDLKLDTTFGLATITWNSSNEAVVSNTGKVVQGDDDVDVTLTATIKVGKAQDTKRFNITVAGLIFESFRVSFNPDGGNPTPEAQTVRDGRAATEPTENPTKDRYSFAGWYLEDAEEAYDFATPVEENISLTAKWELTHPVVTFNLAYSGAPQIEPQRLELGEKAVEPTDPERDRYEFIGWTLDGEAYDFNVEVNEDTILTANWKQLEAIVSFDLGYGEDHPEDQIVDIGQKAAEPTNPERDRYEFLGWFIEGVETAYDFDAALTKDVHLVARWKQLVAIITFDVAGGSPKPADVTMDIGDGQSLSEPPEPAKGGYNFIGWLDGSVLYDFSQPVERDLNLVANWQESDLEISATIVGPNAITHFMGGAGFDPLADYVGIDNHTQGEYDLFVSAPSYTTALPGTYYYRIALIVDPSIEKVIKLTVKPAVVIPNELTKGQTIEITLWHANGTTIENKLKQYAQDFENLMLTTEGVTLKINIQKNGSNYDELRSNTVNAIKGAELPNLVQNYPDHVVEYSENGVIESLTPYINHPIHGFNSNIPNESFQDIIPAYREENRNNNLIGDYLSLPFNKSTEVAAYNKTFFDAVLAGRSMPQTWQGLFELLDDILAIKDEQIDGIAANWAASGAPMNAQAIAKAKNEFVPFTYDSSANAFITLTRQFGGKYTSRNPETGKGQVEFINPQTMRMLNFFAEDRARTFTVPQFWGVEYGNAVSFQGTTIFSVGSTGGLRYNNAINAGFKLYEVGVMPVPYDSQNPSSRTVIQQGTNISLTNRGTADQRLASWLFLKYLTSTDVQSDFGIATGYSPVRLSSYQTPEYQAFLAKADIPLGDSAAAMGLSNADYAKLAEEILVSKGARAAALQTQFMFYDEAFIGSSKAREEVANAFERVILAPAGSNLETVINNALQAAKEETEKIIS